eukprot:GGOE01042606.1.p1 GENE.GGOE01042606.1~~GGOE01042606.1.p1  ORF type:complete len:220 (-),score=79.59 GGOE01042606.1:159-770(-)
MYDDEGNYVGPPLEEEVRKQEREQALQLKTEKRKKQEKRKRDSVEAELALAAIAPDAAVAFQSPFASQAQPAALGTNSWWAVGATAGTQAEVELQTVGEAERLLEKHEELTPLPRGLQLRAAEQRAAATKAEQEASPTLGLWEKTNAEKQHLARQPKPKRIRSKESEKRDDLGHFFYQDYYVPKGRAGGHSGMFIAKETGEML